MRILRHGQIDIASICLEMSLGSHRLARRISHDELEAHLDLGMCRFDHILPFLLLLFDIREQEQTGCISQRVDSDSNSDGNNSAIGGIARRKAKIATALPKSSLTLIKA